MKNFLRTLLLAAIASCVLPACAPRKPKSSARIYAGDAPTIKYSDRAEVAGGRVNTY